MTDSATYPERSGRGRSFTSHPLPAIVDWLVGAVIALGGLGMLAGGVALSVVVDRETIADGVASGTIEGDFMSPAETVELGTSVATWTGIGLLVTGVVVLAVAIWVVRTQGLRREQAAAGETVRYVAVSAILGAVISAVLSFMPFSPVIGGGAAGYLEAPESGRSVRVGAYSGVLTVAAGIVIVAFLFVGLVLGAVAVGDGGLGLLLAVVGVLAMLVLATIGGVLGAIGGYVGGRLADRGAA